MGWARVKHSPDEVPSSSTLIPSPCSRNFRKSFGNSGSPPQQEVGFAGANRFKPTRMAEGPPRKKLRGWTMRKYALRPTESGRCDRYGHSWWRAMAGETENRLLCWHCPCDIPVGICTRWENSNHRCTRSLWSAILPRYSSACGLENRHGAWCLKNNHERA